jgi:hypothetical protein
MSRREKVWVIKKEEEAIETTASDETNCYRMKISYAVANSILKKKPVEEACRLARIHPSSLFR